MIAALRLFHDLGKPAIESGDETRDAQAQNDAPGCAEHFQVIMHEHHHAGGEGQRRKRADHRPDVRCENVIIVVFGAGHNSVLLFAFDKALNVRAAAGPEP